MVKLYSTSVLVILSLESRLLLPCDTWEISLTEVDNNRGPKWNLVGLTINSFGRRTMPIVLMDHRKYTEILVEYNFTLCKVNVLWHLSFLGRKMIRNVCIASHDFFLAMDVAIRNTLNTQKKWKRKKKKWRCGCVSRRRPSIFTAMQFPPYLFSSRSCWLHFTPSSWSNLKSKPIQVNSQPTPRNRAQEETETCLRWPSLLCCFFLLLDPLRH